MPRVTAKTDSSAFLKILYITFLQGGAEETHVFHIRITLFILTASKKKLLEGKYTTLYVPTRHSY
jgi:hypothetical protein